MVNEELIKVIDKAIADTEKELNNNDEWKERFKGYATNILANKEKKEKMRGKLHQWEPLKFYTAIGDATKNPNELFISVRYLGQQVATVNAKDDGVYVYTDSNKDTINTSNKEYFNCDIRLEKEEKCKWDSNKAKAFRKHFRKNEEGKPKSKEHRIESMLLAEFAKHNAKNKKICGIQPIKIYKMPFQMASAISSSGEIKYGNGNIDILARIRDNDGSVKIVLFELKKEYKPVKEVLRQATGYATFLSKLLHSESGDMWYEIFGFGGKVDSNLTIKVCSVMPENQKGESEVFDVFERKCGDDTFEYHYLYLKDDENEIIVDKHNLNEKPKK